MKNNFWGWFKTSSAPARCLRRTWLISIFNFETCLSLQQRLIRSFSNPNARYANPAIAYDTYRRIYGLIKRYIWLCNRFFPKEIACAKRRVQLIAVTETTILINGPKMQYVRERNRFATLILNYLLSHCLTHISYHYSANWTLYASFWGKTITIRSNITSIGVKRVTFSESLDEAFHIHFILNIIRIIEKFILF